MRAIFLADVHLKGPGDPAQEKMLRFLAGFSGRGEIPARQGAGELPLDHLVIAGDFFDFWLARGERAFRGFDPVLDRLAALKRAGVRISLCEGNHDFSLAGYFAGRRGMEVYPEWAEFDMDGRRVLVSHGDTIDRSNRRYLALRRFLRSGLAAGLQRCIPLSLLWGIARFSSKLSKGMGGVSGVSDDRLAEIMYRFAQERFGEGFDAVILGHCHLPVLRRDQSAGGEKVFATLGDWQGHDSYLTCTDGRFARERFPESRPAAVSGGAALRP
jgi:UDP-2,3-diacylglucosamine hydrolase